MTRETALWHSVRCLLAANAAAITAFFVPMELALWFAAFAVCFLGLTGAWFVASAMSGSAQDRETGLGPKGASAVGESRDAQ